MRSLLYDAARRAEAYLDGLRTRSVYPGDAQVAALRAWLDQPLADAGSPAHELLAGLDRYGSPATVASAGGRYFGLVVGGALPASVAASFLVAAWDQNGGLRVLSPATAAFEDAVLRDLRDVLGLPAHCEGAIVTGATMANLTGLLAARHALLARRGWDVEARGLFGAPEIPVLVSAETHTSVRKALGLLGLGRERVGVLPVDGQGRIRPDGLAGRIPESAIVCAQAGNVNTGACDLFDALADAVRAKAAWLHVDGAFGLWAAASPRHRQLVAGVERADSWATDAHKWLNSPYDAGVAFVRDGDALRAACSADAAYLPAEAAREPSSTTPEMSRRARAVEIWAALRSLGRSGLAELVERTCRHARRFAAGLREAGHEILNDVVLNQVLISFGSDERTAAVIARVQADGTCWCGPTAWQGRRAMRISVSSWATTDDDVERSLEAVVRCAR